MIKYINVNKVTKTSDKSPSHRVSTTMENGDKLEVGAMWESQYGFNMKLAEGVSFSGLENLKPREKKAASPSPRGESPF